MRSPDEKQPDDLLLRASAERQLDDAQQMKDPLAPAAPDLVPADLLRELQVHQIELEIQNEALRLKQIELESMRDRYVDLYDFAPVGYLTLDSNGIIEELNLTAVKLLRSERLDLLRRRFSSLLIGAEQERFRELLLAVIDHDGAQRIELAVQRRDGTVFQAQLDCATQKSGAGDTAFRIALTDITERKQAEIELSQYRQHLEQLVDARTADLAAANQSLTLAKNAAEAANRAKSAFLSNMSHELRTPMNGVMGMIDLVLSLATDPKQIDWLKKSKSSARHLLDLINDILDISKIESDRITLEHRDFSLSQVIDSVINMETAAVLVKGLKLSREIDPSLPDVLCGDALRLKQIVINLVGNAVKFSSHGKITVRARAVEKSDSGLLLRIEVTDQGIGIAPEQMGRLFQAFTQGDDSMTRKYGGTGLGLIISKRLALLMGGDVGVESAPGVGSTFWFTARLTASAVQPVAERAKASEADATTIRKRYFAQRILVVDDEPINREVAQLQLEGLDLMVDTAEDGTKAVDMARTWRYAAIFMDMQMPNLNGLDATRQIRQLPDYQHVPIIAMTANVFVADKVQCLAAGMNDFLIKPFTRTELMAILLRVPLTD
jgi:PAS domain S-box-containing protein